MALSKERQFEFAQQLLTLLNAGLALLNAIELIQASAPKEWQSWLEHIQSTLRKGDSFSQSLASQGKQFSIEFINLIRVSERTGDLVLALHTISQQLEAQIELRRKIQQALSYPVITLGSACLLVIVMMIWVVPVFKEVFSHFQAELPLPTKTLLQASAIMNHFFLEICTCLFGSATLFFLAWMKSPSLQRKCDLWSLQMPLLGRLFRLAALVYWCRTLGHLLSSGLALPDALRVTAQSSNHWLSHDLSAEVFKHLTRGWSLGEALNKADPKKHLFDTQTLQLLHIASESGFLPEMLGKRANTLSAQLGAHLNNLSHTLEPLLIITVGIIIGSLVIILYLPIFNLGQII
ncbi:type II secretion system F family protein [Polynucleobacter sp. UK-Kesae-W10]|uniref:type II secretion system F family protein n=1 Tax=Polynucleobacter sp. UK-Kesae-W10 TaxID=1819738 RepID=UPI001C0E0C87|nr:type II secretion system F family protein [Polynucleobacter sp. UK-Kesae-W10]MBU3576805.1 type II secretion system F family protein [Polynucleobacter sp. UK-Kesae-W10]